MVDTRKMNSKRNRNMKEIENQAMPSLFKNYQLLMRLVNRLLHYGRISMQNDQGHRIQGHFMFDPARMCHQNANGSSNQEFTEMNCV